MGDLTCTWDRKSGAWVAPISTSRTSIEWSHRVVGVSLTGMVAVPPDRRVGRHAVAVRDSV